MRHISLRHTWFARVEPLAPLSLTANEGEGYLCQSCSGHNFPNVPNTNAMLYAEKGNAEKEKFQKWVSWAQTRIV